MAVHDYDEARDALFACDPACSREDWVRHLMAAHAAGISQEDADRWSSQADNYKERDFRSVWSSIKPGKGIGPGTLYMLAKQANWRPEQPRRVDRPSAVRQPQGRVARGLRVAPAAAEVWARCIPATNDHPYIDAKQGIADGLRVLPSGDPFRIAGASVAGWLVVPVRAMDGGEPVSLQFIPPPGAGKKLNLPGAPVAGVFVVGSMLPGGTAYLCEGIGQAWACWKATGAAAVVCFGWGRVRAVTAELRQRDARARLVLVPDAGKEAEAAAIASEFDAQYVTMPAGSPSNFDANDLAQRDGFDALEHLLAHAEGAGAASSCPGWVEAVRQWRPPQDLSTFDAPVRFAVDGWIQAGKVGALVAAGSTGKTTLMLILAICVATGRAFFGQAVQQGSFVLLSNDDSQEDLNLALSRVGNGMELTTQEWELVRTKVRVVSLQGLDGTKTFTMPEHGAATATGLEALILQAVEGITDLVGVVLDTLRQFSGGNSNDEQTVKLTISGATEVAAKTGAFVLFTHHTGKQNYRDGITDMYAGSGSAAIADNCRFVLLLQTTTWPDIESKVRRTGQEDGSPLVLTATRGSLLVKAPEPMFLHRSGFTIERVAGAVLTSDQLADERDRAVLRAVRDGHQTKTAIAQAVRGRKADALARVDSLTGRGLLALGNQSGTARLMVTARGALFLDAS